MEFLLYYSLLSYLSNIELDGILLIAFHFKYRKTLCESNYSLRMSIMKFKDEDILINNGEWNKQGHGILFVYRYNDLYDHNYTTGTISMNGKARFLHLNIE